MVDNKYKRSEKDDEAPGLPGMKPEFKRLYDDVRAAGAIGPTAGRTSEELAKDLHVGRNRLEEGLERLEGMGVVSHLTTGDKTTWFTRK